MLTLTRLLAGVALALPFAFAQDPPPDTEALEQALRACPYRLIFESFRDGNWELMRIKPDGSQLENLTNTPDVDELYPQSSPDGTKIAFMADEGPLSQRRRAIWLMDADGANRVEIADNGREPFWSPDGAEVGYALGTFKDPMHDIYANEGLYFYNVETGKTRVHPNKDISAVLSPCFSKDGRWIVTSLMRSRDIGEAIVAIQADGLRIVELIHSARRGDTVRLWQCRPDISPDNRKIAWGKEDDFKQMWVEVAEANLTTIAPSIGEIKRVATGKPMNYVYHMDWSPDGRFLAFSQGPQGGRMDRARYAIGNKAPGWNIYVCDPAQRETAVQVTTDGMSNKEPEWVKIP